MVVRADARIRLRLTGMTGRAYYIDSGFPSLSRENGEGEAQQPSRYIETVLGAPAPIGHTRARPSERGRECQGLLARPCRSPAAP